MKVLITNDDGIDSPGLHSLVKQSSKLGFSPVVAAPRVNLSGSSASLVPLDGPNRVQVEERVLSEAGHVRAYSVGAPPALITMLAILGGFGDPPDLVLAGINFGPNTGRSTLFSGTIGAVMTAARFGRSGLAISLDIQSSEGIKPAWSTAADCAAPLIRWLAAAPRPMILNLNVPNLPVEQVRGFRQADLAPVGRVRTVITGRDDTGLDIDLISSCEPVPSGTDSTLLEDGYATVTALSPIKALEGDLPIEACNNEIGVSN